MEEIKLDPSGGGLITLTGPGGSKKYTTVKNRVKAFTSGIVGEVMFAVDGMLSGRSIPYTSFQDADGDSFADVDAVLAYVQANFNMASGGGATPGELEAVLNEAKDYTDLNIAVPAMFLSGDHFEVTKWYKPDGVTETTSSDPEAVPFVSLKSGTQPEQLPTPVFGTVSKTANSLSIPVTNLPSGATIEWTFDGVVDNLQTGTPFVKSGLTAETEYSVSARFLKPGLTDGPSSEISVTTNAEGGSYVVERRIKINPEGEYSSPSGVSGWNDLLVSNADIAEDGGYDSGFLNTATGANTAIKITAPKSWSGTNAQVLSPWPSGALLPELIGNNGFKWDAWDSTPSIQIAGLDPVKYYQVYVAALSNEGPTDEMNIAIGADVKSKVTYNNYGVNADPEMESPMWVVFNNKQGSSITIDFSKKAGGVSFNVVAIVIEESSVPKP